MLGALQPFTNSQRAFHRTCATLINCRATQIQSCVQVAGQHTRNRGDALVCEHCFRYIGPVELQLGFRLLHCTPPPGVACVKDTATALLRGSMRLPHVDLPGEATPCPQARDASGNTATVHESSFLVPREWRQLAEHCDRCPAEDAHANSGHHSSQRSPFGAAVVLGDGSPHLFCSHDCAAIAWVTWAALLSPGEAGDIAGDSRPQSSEHEQPTMLHAVLQSPYVEVARMQRTSHTTRQWCTLHGRLAPFGGPSEGDSPSISASGPLVRPFARPSWLPALPAGIGEALRLFGEHADSTNDIFHVAARAVAKVASVAFASAALRRRLGQPNVDTVSEGSRADVAVTDVHWQEVAAAWRPFQAVCRAIWWEHVPMPDDVTDEQAWRMHLQCVSAPVCMFEATRCRTAFPRPHGHTWLADIEPCACRELAEDSLTLLRAALAPVVPSVLLDHRVWGSLVGMFELNNLDLCVQSPLENFFLAVDDLPEPAKTAAEAVTQPLLDALDSSYAACVEVCSVQNLLGCVRGAPAKRGQWKGQPCSAQNGAKPTFGSVHAGNCPLRPAELHESRRQPKRIGNQGR